MYAIRSYYERQAGRSLARRRQVVGAAREYVQAHPDEVIAVPQLCAQLGVSLV